MFERQLRQAKCSVRNGKVPGNVRGSQGSRPTAIRILSTAKIAALSCSEVRSRYFIVSQAHPFSEGLLLILRHYHQKSFDVVDQAVTLDCFRLASMPSQELHVATCNISLDLSAEVTMLFVGQDLCGDAHEFYSHAGRLSRLHKGCATVRAVLSGVMS